MWSFASLTCLLAGTWSNFFSCGASIPLPRFDPRPKGTTPRENIALGKFSVACKCIFISNHHLFLQCTTCLSGGIQQHSNTQTQDQTSDSKGLGSRYKCMCIFQVECVLVSILSSKNYYFNGQLFMKAQRNIRCYICKWWYQLVSISRMSGDFIVLRREILFIDWYSINRFR